MVWDWWWRQNFITRQFQHLAINAIIAGQNAVVTRPVERKMSAISGDNRLNAFFLH